MLTIANERICTHTTQLKTHRTLLSNGFNSSSELHLLRSKKKSCFVYPCCFLIRSRQQSVIWSIIILEQRCWLMANVMRSVLNNLFRNFIEKLKTRRKLESIQHCMSCLSTLWMWFSLIGNTSGKVNKIPCAMKLNVGNFHKAAHLHATKSYASAL